MEAHVNHRVPVVLPDMARMEGEDAEFRNSSAEKHDFLRRRRIDEPFVGGIAVRKRRFECGDHLRF